MGYRKPILVAFACILSFSAHSLAQGVTSPAPSPQNPPVPQNQSAQQLATPQQNVGITPAPAFGQLLKVVNAANSSTPPPAKTDVPPKPDLKAIHDLIDNLLLPVRSLMARQPVRLQLSPPTGMIANYHFPGDPNFHAFPAEPLTLPDNVDMVLVRLTQCSGTCHVVAALGPPQECPQPASSDDAHPSKSKQTKKEIAAAKAATGDFTPCERDIVFVRDLFSKADDKGDIYLQPAFIVSVNGLQIASVLPSYVRAPSHPNYTVNGTPVSSLESNDKSGIDPTGSGLSFNGPILGWQSVRRFRIERYAGSVACTKFDSSTVEALDIDKPMIAAQKDTAIDNGIAVSPAKVFDSFTLRQMLANTSAQLASISGFNQGSLIGALGNIQGITRDTSYISGQVTTVGTPSVSSTAVNGGTASNTLANSLGASNGTTVSNSTITCPPGTLPGIGTSGLPACAAVVAGTATVGSTGAGNTAGGSSLLQSIVGNNGTTASSTANSGLTTNQQNTVTTSTTGQAGVAAPIPTSTAFAAPTNLGLSSSDMLAEQVQLNSEITTLRLLLQGALSDQYLVKDTRAVGSREQTTVGFGINVDPPARFRHAVAEVKVYVEPDNGADPVSVMNLLPAAKTYNVARITSHQSAFGAGAVIEPVSIGVSTGKSKDRLYLAKDTDTVAMQYQLNSRNGGSVATLPLSRSAQEHIGDRFKEAVIWQTIDDACDDVQTDPNAIVFGWQFRPVLGADYVQAGQRLVYAQLALPVGLGEQYAPRVHVQTRWREYDEKRQVLGPIYHGSCSIEEDVNPITVISPLRVHTVQVNDLGGGALKVAAQGEFFTSGFIAMNGAGTIAPTTFDGRNLQLIASAQSLLLADDLKLVGEDGSTTRLATASRFQGESCGIKSETVKALATPRPDGNSVVEVTFTTGSNYSIAIDGQPKPLILIGAQTYGLRETPFVDGKCDAPKTSTVAATSTTAMVPGSGSECTYHFLAATDVIRSAERLQVADLAWSAFRGSGTIKFAPAFASMSSLATQKPAKKSDPDKKGSHPGDRQPTPPPQLYMLTGFELDSLSKSDKLNCHSNGCLSVYRGLQQFCLGASNFQVLSKTNAVLSLDDSKAYSACVTSWANEKPPITAPAKEDLDLVSQIDYKSLRFLYYPQSGYPIEWVLALPSATPVSVAASTILNVGDSTQLTFTGVSVTGKVQSLMYESTVFPSTSYKYDSTKKTLTVQIPSLLTAKAGHKELILTDSALASDGKVSQILLPFDVTRR